MTGPFMMNPDNFPMIVLYNDNKFDIVPAPGQFRNGVQFTTLLTGLPPESVEHYRTNKEAIDLDLAKTLANVDK